MVVTPSRALYSKISGADQPASASRDTSARSISSTTRPARSRTTLTGGWSGRDHESTK